MKIDRREICRYLGIAGRPEAERIAPLIEESVLLLEKAADPRFLYEIVPLSLGAEHTVDMGFLQTQSRNLSRNLLGCRQAAVMAATLGIGTDRMINRMFHLDAAKATVMQAAAAAMIEAWCDVCQETIRQEAARRGLFLRPRFSPGYGDFPLKSQKAILQGLQAQKKIGLTVTDSLMMIPVKSVTAVIGLSEENSFCHKNGCEVCPKDDCAYRRQSISGKG